eukprot:m.699901 g.699901  ORF g.699901 m.699901 type:complete len:291 (+) comp58695_c0_seq4:66-938(+)
MIDMLTANNGKVTNTRRVTMCVLDEADRMFDMGFEPQVMRILDNVRPDRQTVMFSATFPRQMEALARRILKKPVEVQVGGRSIVSNTVQQNVLVINEDQKFFKLLELLGNYQSGGSTLIFVAKQGSADILQQELMKKQYTSLTLHGGLDQIDRDSNIFDFKQGNVSILIATSVAARGLDVKAINLVVNFDCPNHYEDYVHRCGRTGRAGRQVSLICSFSSSVPPSLHLSLFFPSVSLDSQSRVRLLCVLESIRDVGFIAGNSVYVYHAGSRQLCWGYYPRTGAVRGNSAR